MQTDTIHRPPIPALAARAIARFRALDDRAVDRLIKRIGLILLVGIPLIGVLYATDQFRPAGPSILEQTVAQAEADVRAEPNKLSARLKLAGVYMAAERYQDAFTQYDAVIAAQPDDRTSLMGRGMALISLDRLDEAAADFQHVLALGADEEMANVDPQLETAYYQLGVIALQQGKPEAALEPLLAALKIDRADADALLAYADALLKTGDPERAALALRKAVALVPSGWCEPYATLSDAYTALQDEPGARYATGMVAVCEKRYDEGRTALLALVDGDHAVEAMLGLAQVAEATGDVTAAGSYYAAVLEREPQNFLALSGLGRAGTGTGAHPAVPGVSPAASGSH